MATPINILIAEDSPDDADMVMHELRRAGFEPKWKRVETEPAFLAELKNAPDIILSDYSMPEFTGLRAAELVKASGLDIPFILISGTVGEEIAVTAMKHGATDYLLKDRLVRLGQAVENALEQKRLRDERRRAEERVAGEQARFKLIFDSVPIGIAYCGQQPDGQCVRIINDAHLKICGLTREQDQTPGIYKQITHPEDAARQAELGRALNDGRDGQMAMEKRYLRPDGAVVWVAFTFRRQHCADGSIEELTTVVDITERKRAEAALDYERDLLRTLLDNSPDMIYFKDTQSRFVKGSKSLACQFGVESPEALAGRTDFDFFDESHARPAFEDEQAIIRTGRPMIGKEEREEWKTGEVRWVSSTKMPWFDSTGKIIGIIGITRDITEHQKLEEQFRQSQKMESFGQLAGGVAHDFNNILAIIQMQAGLLKAGSLPPAQAKFADEISATVERAAALTSQLLIFSRKQSLRPHDLDLNERANSMAKMLLRILGEQITLQLNLAAQPLFVHADPGMMDQVLMNLAVNARDAMPKGGRLVIETSAVDFDESVRAQSAQARPGPFVCLSVGDNGDGIPPEILPRIFEPFFTTKGVGKGTGLGLATVFGIVQQHHGWINVYSEVGSGTTVNIFLPRLSSITTDAHAAQKMPAVAPTGRETILLVEDEPSLRLFIQMTLSQLGYHILEAASGVKALEVWHDHRDEIGLLLTDLMMPDGMNGKELAHRLRQENPELKVLFMSGYSPEIAGPDFPMQTGVNFLPKPFHMQELAQIVRKCLDKSPENRAG